MRREGAAIHLLLTDVIMPCMSGRELADRLCAARPRLALLYMTGYAPEDVLKGESGLGPGQPLAKPFSRNELLAAVRGVLDANRVATEKPV